MAPPSSSASATQPHRELVADCDSLRQTAQNLRNELAALRATASFDDMCGLLVARAEVAVDHALACALLAEGGLVVPSAVIVRSLLEAFFGTYWASVSAENAHRLNDASRREVVRLMKLNLREGNAAIRHRVTGEDLTASFLREPKLSDAGRLPRFDHLARDAGLKRVYESLYGLMSMFAHGVGADIIASGSGNGFLKAQLDAAMAILECYHKIVLNRVCQNRTLTEPEVAAILRIPL